MKYIVSGDQHIKISKELPLEWQLKRFRLLWQTYVDLCKEHHAELILTGDMFHSPRPNLHEIMLFMELCNLLEANGITTVIFAGNHENMGASGTTLDYLKPSLDSMTFVYYSTAIVEDYDHKDDVELFFVGHNHLQEWVDSHPPKTEKTRIVFSHFRPTVNQFILEEINVAKFLDTADVVFASDIHTEFAMYNKLIYTNAPLNNHFEPAPNCGCLLVSCDSGSVTWKRISLRLPNLVQVTTTAGKYQEIEDSYNFYRVEITGPPEDLRWLKATTPNVKLHKIPDVAETYTELEITSEVKDQSLEDALIAYMQELEYTEDKIQAMMEVMRGPQ